MKTTNGEVISLIWPDGNDDGELFVRGHFPDREARDILLRESDELDVTAIKSLSIDYPDSMAVEVQSRALLDKARVERIYARWSQESREEGLTAVLRIYTKTGRGRFPVTRATLFPRTPCYLSVRTGTGIYNCLKCGRRFRGPADPHNLTGPSDCDRLVGDEHVDEFTDVYEELDRSEEAA